MTYTIKKLEWKRSKIVWTASVPGRLYVIEKRANGYKGNSGKIYLTLEAAKQAAQDHWEGRLKEALVEVEG